MKKIFTLIAMAVMAVSANAQTWNFSDSKFNELGTISETVTIDGLTIAANADKTVVIDENKKSIDGYEFTHRAKMGGAGSAEARYLSFGAPANSTVTVYGMSANSSATDRNLVIAAGNMDNKLYDAPLLGDKIYKVEQKISEPSVVYIYSGNSGLNFYCIKVETGGDTPGPVTTGESYSPINVAADGSAALALDFLAYVNENGEATNVKDGKSVITVNTENVTMEAVGGATPANIDGGAQDITPGDAMPDYVDQKGEAHPYAHKVASVGSWAPIKWENKNNKTDINDEAGTKLYFLMGTGNPYINMFCEEIVTDDVPTGKYRAIYEYYQPGMDMPETGLYYKFTTKTDGKMKVQVWANKGNRNTYLINGQSKEAVAYKAEGYINGQKVVDAEGNKVLNADGQEIMKFFTAEEIQQVHNDAKVVDGVDTAPYVIAAGNQAFWGWITFDAKAGVDYWLFQDSSQVGFGGFEFNAGGIDAIETVKAEKVQDNKMYNLQGQVVGNDYKGIVIMNGKKFIKK